MVYQNALQVSILVLMDLCIKTPIPVVDYDWTVSFNPCFNGSMYKNGEAEFSHHQKGIVSILVLMDLCIKTGGTLSGAEAQLSCFNPCFNGSMYKNVIYLILQKQKQGVSILVLMDLCIKTYRLLIIYVKYLSFNPCFNGSMYKNYNPAQLAVCHSSFQSLF